MLTLDNTTIAAGQARNITAWTVGLASGSLTLSEDVQNAMVDGATALLNRGDGPAKILVYTAGFASLLITFTAADPAMGAAVAGTATADGVPLGAIATGAGVAAVCRVVDSDDVMLWEDTVEQA